MPIAAGIYYHSYEGGGTGSRPPVVLIHGAAGNYLYWPAEIRRLPGFRVFAIDLPGHGKSGGRGFQKIEPYVEAVIDWMDAQEIYRAVFVGHSMGGAIVLTAALKFPQRIEALVLLGSGARLKVAPQLLENAASPSTWISTAQTIVDWSFSPKAPNRLKELAGKRMMEGRPSVLYGDLQACSDFDVTEEIQQINAPALILCGSDDKMTPPRVSEYLAANIPNSRFIRISGAGHMVQLEKPEETANEIFSFLTGIRHP